jgi:hypothetical protein
MSSRIDDHSGLTFSLHLQQTRKSLKLGQEKALVAVDDLMRARNMLAEELGWALHPDIPRSSKQ